MKNKKQNNKSAEKDFDTKAFWSEVEDAIVSGKAKSVKNLKEAKSTLKHSTQKTIKETKQISIRVNARDLAKLKARAIQKDLPYQTLINALLKKFVNNDVRL